VIKPEDPGIFRVVGKKVEKLAAMTHFDQAEGLRRFQNILKEDGRRKRSLPPGRRTRRHHPHWELGIYFEVDDEKPRNLPTKKPYKPTRKG